MAVGPVSGKPPTGRALQLPHFTHQSVTFSISESGGDSVSSAASLVRPDPLSNPGLTRIRKCRRPSDWAVFHLISATPLRETRARSSRPLSRARRGIRSLYTRDMISLLRPHRSPRRTARPRDPKVAQFVFPPLGVQHLYPCFFVLSFPSRASSPREEYCSSLRRLYAAVPPTRHFPPSRRLGWPLSPHRGSFSACASWFRLRGKAQIPDGAVGSGATHMTLTESASCARGLRREVARAPGCGFGVPRPPGRSEARCVAERVGGRGRASRAR